MEHCPSLPVGRALAGAAEWRPGEQSRRLEWPVLSCVAVSLLPPGTSFLKRKDSRKRSHSSVRREAKNDLTYSFLKNCLSGRKLAQLPTPRKVTAGEESPKASTQMRGLEQQQLIPTLCPRGTLPTL